MQRTGFRVLFRSGWFASSLLAATGAHAACAQADLVGNWQLYVVTFDGTSVNDAGWVRCGITVSAAATNNVRLATGGVGRNDLGVNYPVVTVGSTLTVNAACGVSGVIKSNPFSLTITQMTMSLDQTRLTGVGSVTGGQLFMATGEKF